MKKKLLISFISIFIVVGGIFVVRGFTQTGVTALDDSFTREFLDEDIEVGKGFYFYEARNGKYTMWFPEDFYINKDQSFYQSNERMELVRLLSSESAKYDESIQLNYRGRSHDNKNTIESRFQELLVALSFNS
ncbi:hypothetical protein [Alkalicoccobacillus porphyridii]|uniref:Uncharacterized protein n=1 Tax=Alkalicoccobacillus porphyridii TaxID=2597270 RepID=A0A554A4C7_9BACI|nr:hypothetical protein [Alkalicoccobacillus porphyridii]TSB48543.1 hypothetical protein FN960_03035 [Alkalicoccobacillus porphyridii]